jgi:hypothetical protein
MIGQSFAPLGNGMPAKPDGGGVAPGAQQAIKVLNLRLPRVVGSGAPAPGALLNAQGASGLPSAGTNPMLEALIHAVMGGYAPATGAGPTPGASGPSSPLPMPSAPVSNAPVSLPNPAIHYQPLPGGTAGPNPKFPVNQDTREDRMNKRGKGGQDNFAPVLG